MMTDNPSNLRASSWTIPVGLWLLVWLAAVVAKSSFFEEMEQTHLEQERRAARHPGLAPQE